jgi:hypothetical protein
VNQAVPNRPSFLVLTPTHCPKTHSSLESTVSEVAE